MIPEPSLPIEFHPSPQVVKQLTVLLKVAAKRGVLNFAMEAFADVTRILTRTPRAWGDPVRIIRKAEITEYRGLHWDLRCRYAVHDRVPIVFLTDITPLEDNPLFGT